MDKKRLLTVPKLLVIVDKDDTGKLWNCIVTEEAAGNQNSSRPGPLWIHKSGPLGTGPQPVQPREHAEEDHVTLGVLLPQEEARVHTRIMNK